MDTYSDGSGYPGRWFGQVSGQTEAKTVTAINLSDFLQNPQFWMNELSRVIGENSLIQSLCLFCMYILGGMTVYTVVFKGAMRNNYGIIAITLLKAILVMALLSSARTGTGPIRLAIDQSVSTWVSLYNISAGIVNPRMVSVVTQSTTAMANATKDFIKTAGAASGVADLITSTQMADIASPVKDSAVTSLVTQELNARQAQPIDSASWIVQLGYFIILGFFSLFMAIIIGSGFTVILTSLVMPFGVTAWGIGDGKMLRYLLAGIIAAWLTAAATPFVMLVASGLAIKLPQSIMTAQIKNQTQDLNQKALQFRDEIRTCQSAVTGTGNDYGIPDWLGGDQICTGVKGFLASISSVVEGFANLIRGFILFVIALLIGQAVAASMLRRVPGFLGSALATGIDTTVHGVGSIGMGMVSRATSGAMRGMAGPTRMVATGAGMGLNKGANAVARGSQQLAQNTALTLKENGLAREMKRSVNDAPGQSAQQQYSNASARMGTEYSTQQGPQTPYTGNSGTQSGARGTAAGIGKTNTRK